MEVVFKQNEFDLSKVEVGDMIVVGVGENVQTSRLIVSHGACFHAVNPMYMTVVYTASSLDELIKYYTKDFNIIKHIKSANLQIKEK